MFSYKRFVMCSMWQMFSDGLMHPNIPVAPDVLEVIESAAAGGSSSEAHILILDN